MPTIFIVGGTGQIGRAVAERFARAGWRVRLGARRPSRATDLWQSVRLDRTIPGALGRALGDGADLLLDCIAFDAADADRLIAVQGAVGRIVAVSSASVYSDAQGRTLDEARDRGFPVFPVPINEDNPTVAAGPATYSTRKVAMETRLLDSAGIPVTILRPAAVHGPHSKHAREWWLVKRLLDGRPRIPLAYGGRSRFQTTSAEAIAAAVWHAAAGQAPAVANVADGDAPTVAGIAGTVMAALEREAELVGFRDEPFPPKVGMTPWSTAHALVCASSLPPARRYTETVGPALDWLIGAVAPDDWRQALPQLAAYPRDLFDYAAEDRALDRM